MALREGGESTADVNTSLDRFRFRRSLGLLAIGDGGGALEPGAAAATARLFLLLLFVVAAEWTSFLGDVGGWQRRRRREFCPLGLFPVPSALRSSTGGEPFEGCSGARGGRLVGR